ncbi:hypothetical protein CI15_33455 [Paraburkholderia monticola]|uniref:Uncharacterized protein n=1 Tax=Paraburkholderia monticola TaxID=1399968 RepID=A0A149PBQ6_9BURK|nr:hypothetical protein [Paraburkholderia monticola]KXU82443.1 hypothetical protein CI15_33455 [Paraburkholderia monticola]
MTDELIEGFAKSMKYQTTLEERVILVKRIVDTALLSASKPAALQGQLKRGDMRVIDGLTWHCTDPDIDRWVSNGQPTPAAPAQSANAIYQTGWPSPENVWGDVDKQTYDTYEQFGYTRRRIVHAAPQPHPAQSCDCGPNCLDKGATEGCRYATPVQTGHCIGCGGLVPLQDMSYGHCKECQAAQTAKAGEADNTDYEALERERLGDPEKRTGIYAPKSAVVLDDERAAFPRYTEWMHLREHGQ